MAATIYNVHRKPGSRAAKPRDYIRRPPAILTPEQIEKELDAWARSVNRSQKKKHEA